MSDYVWQPPKGTDPRSWDGRSADDKNSSDQSQTDNSQPSEFESEPNANLSFWESPEHVVSYHNLLEMGKNQPGWQPPAGLDVEGIENTYQYMKFKNQDRLESDWQPLSADDPAVSALRSMPAPPEGLLPAVDQPYKDQVALAEKNYAQAAEPIKQVGDWDEMEWSRQVMLSLIGAGEDTMIKDRPEWTRAPATIVQGVMGGIGPAAVATAVSGGNVLVGALAMLAFGGIAGYQAYTGDRIPVISDVYDKFSILSQGVESLWGEASLNMTPEERMKAILEDPVNIIGQFFGATPTASLAAGAQKYESSKPDVMNMAMYALDTMYNAGSDTAGLLGGGWKKVSLDWAKEGERWDIQKGINDPVKIAGVYGDVYLNSIYQKLKDATPENFDQVRAEIQQDAYERFGYSGVLNDLVGQTILDPLNLAPFVEGIGMEKFGKLMKSERLVEVAGRMKGNPMIDVLPIGIQQLTEALVRGKPGAADWKPFGVDIGTLGRRHSSGGMLGTINEYKSEIQRGLTFGSVKPIQIDQLSKFDRFIAGIDERGRIKDFVPVQKTGEGVIDSIRHIADLDPESQAINFASLVGANIEIIGQDSGSNIAQFDADLHAIARTGDPEAVGKVVDQFDYATSSEEDKLNFDRKQAMLHSPVAATIAEGLRYALNKTDQAQYMLQWQASEPMRNTLLALADGYGDKPGKFLEALSGNQEEVFKKLSSTPEGIAVLQKFGIDDAATLKSKLDIYIGKGNEKIPWHPDEMKSVYINKLLDTMGEYMVNTYGIKPKGAAMRFIGALKEVQSLLVLGINPGYFVNNIINNVVTRAAQGVWGFMTDNQANDALRRLGMDKLSRLKEGVGAAGEGMEGGGIAALRRATVAKGKVENFRKSVREINKTFGIFQKFSQTVERSESFKAYTLGIMDFMGKSWKVDTGFDRLPPGIEKQLDAINPGLKDAYYECVRSGFNMEEIKQSLSKELIAPQTKAIFDQAVNEIDPQFGDVLHNAISQLGLEEEFTKKLADTRTAQDVDLVVNEIKTKLTDVIHSKRVELLKGAAEEVKGRMKAEGSVASLEIFMKMQETITHDYLAHFKEWFDLFDAYKDATFEVRNKAVKALQDRQFEGFQQVHEYEIASYNGIIQGLGIDTPESQAFVSNITKLHDLTDTFFTDRNKLHQELFNSGARGEEWQKLRSAYDKRTRDMFSKYNQDRNAILVNLNTQFSGMLLKFTGDKMLADLSLSWRKAVMDLENKRQKAMDSMFKQLSAENIKGTERNQAWHRFIQDVYTPMVLELKKMEMDGANALRSRPPDTGVPVEPGPETPPPAPAAPENAPEDRRQNMVENDGVSIPDAAAMDDNAVVKAEAEINPVPTEPLPVQDVVPVISAPGTPETIAGIIKLAQDALQDIKLTPEGAMERGSEIHILNTVNKYIPEIRTKAKPDGTREPFTKLSEIPLEDAEIAYANRNNERSQVREHIAIQARLNAEKIADLHDENIRKAEIAAMGKKSRIDIEDYYRSAFDTTNAKLKAIMMLIDSHADRWAKENGFTPSAATRDAWYATHISEILSVDDPGKITSLPSNSPEFVKKLGQPSSAQGGFTPQDAYISWDQIKNIVESTRVRNNDNMLIEIFGRPGNKEQRIQLAAAVVMVDKVDRARASAILDKIPVEFRPTREEIQSALIRGGFSKPEIEAYTGMPLSKTLGQSDYSGRRADVFFNKDGEAIIRAFQSKDFSSMVHETFHIFIRDITDGDLDKIIKWSGSNLSVDRYYEIRNLWDSKPFSEWSSAEKALWPEFEKVEEKWANGGERYMAEGIAPTPELRPLFAKFRDWILKVYSEIRQYLGIDVKDQLGGTNADVDIHVEIDGVRIDKIFDKLLADQENAPDTFDAILSKESSKPNKTIGFNEDQRQFIAQRNALKNVLGAFQSEEEARATIYDLLGKESLSMKPETFQAPIGDVDSVTLSDALDFMNRNPVLNIWKNKDKVPMVHGNISSIILSPDNKTEYKAHYAVVELKDIVNDTDWQGFTPVNNVEYPRESQNRIRTQMASQKQMLDIASQLNPTTLMLDSGQINVGAPIIGLDYVVDAGNGRIGGLKYAAQNVQDNFLNYRSKLDLYAAKYGIDPADYADMKEPTLVRIIDSPMTEKERQSMAYGSNNPVGQERNPLEIALSDANLITDDMLANIAVDGTETLEAALSKQKNTWFLQRFTSGLPSNELSRMMNGEGGTNTIGYNRIVNAIVARVFPGDSGSKLLDIIANGTKSPVNAAIKELLNTLPLTAKVESMIANGDVRPEYTFAEDVSVAIRRLEEMKSAGDDNRQINAWILSRSMFADAYTPMQKEMVGIFNNLQKPSLIRAFLEKYMQLALEQPNPRQATMGGLFEMEPVSKQNIFDAAKKYAGIIDKVDVDVSANLGLSKQNVYAEMPDAPGREKVQGKVVNSPAELAAKVKLDNAKKLVNAGKVVSLDDLDQVLKSGPDPESPDAPFDFDRIGMTLGQPTEIGGGTYDTNDAAIVFRSETDAPLAKMYPLDRDTIRPQVTYQLRPDVLQGLSKEIGQDIDASQIMTAYASGKKAFVLSNGTGTGKTWVGSGVIAEIQPRKAVIIVPNEQVANGWISTLQKYFGITVSGKLSDVAKSGPVGPGIYWDTYRSVGQSTSDGRSFGNDFDFIAYDESHKLKNYGKKTGDDAEANVNLYRNSPNSKALFLSATPFQDLDEMKYLAPLGLWGNTEMDFNNFLTDHGYFQRLGFDGKSMVWVKGGDTTEALLDVRRQMVEGGVFSQRELSMDKKLDNVFRRVEMSGEFQTTYNQIDQIFQAAIGQTYSPKLRGIISSQRTLALRRVMEMAKIKAAIPLAKQKLAEGRQVAIFVQFKGELRAPNIKYQDNLRIAIEDVYSGLSENGMIENLVREMGGDASVARIYGERPEKEVAADIRAYNNGTKKIAVVTTAKGGTGLSLHDTNGNAPRAQINITLPWSAQDFTQVAGRSYRYGTASDTEQYWLFANAFKEYEISQTVAGRMRSMGAVVRGIKADASAEAISAFDHGVLESESYRDQFLNERKVAKGISDKGLQGEAVDPFQLETGQLINGVIYYNGQEVAYKPSSLQVSKVFQSPSGKSYQVLGYSVKNTANTVVYIPAEDRVFVIDAQKPSLGQPVHKSRVTGFESFIQPSFMQPANPEEGLPLFTGKPVEPEPLPEKKAPVIPVGQTQMLDFVENPTQYSPQFDLNKTMPKVNKVKIYFQSKSGVYDLVIADVTDQAKIQSAIESHPDSQQTAYQVVSLNGKIIQGGHNLSELLSTAAERRAEKAGQEMLFDKPTLGQPLTKEEKDLLDYLYRAAPATFDAASKEPISPQKEWKGIQYKIGGKSKVDLLDSWQRTYDITEKPSLGQPLGSTSSGKTPGSLFDSEVLNEAYGDMINGALSQFSEDYKARLLQKNPGMNKMSPELVSEIEKWLNRVNTQLTSAKLGAQRYGEMQRDASLLNYTWRYNADNYINMVFPYAFWYLRTMATWGGRMIDRPAWFSMYARQKQAQEKIETKGIPSRFAGQIRAYAPWLPDWAGSNLFQDPLQQLFPLKLYSDLGEGMQYEISNIDRNAQASLKQMMESGQISEEQYNSAISNSQDPLYQQAYEDARKQSEMYNPVGLASMMMQPGAWITMPYNISKGTPQKISILPVTKTSRAFGTALKGTVLEPFGNIVELMGAGPETAVRKNTGLSPYGQWGDYYIDREISNLVADGLVSPTDGIIAMIDKKGDAYDQAIERVRTEEMYKVPLMTALNQVANTVSGKGSASAIAPALYHSAMPFGIFPEGEMKQRGLAAEYSKAWDMMKAGDIKAINKFFEAHPEYQARLAINKEPDERMKQLLINQVWDRYNKIPAADKRLVSEGLGEVFQTNFLSNETNDYETLDIPTLAYWAQALGASIPETAGKVPLYQQPKLQTYSPALSDAISAYKSEKNKKFPMIDAEQQAYFAAPSAQQKQILERFPQIKEYWDWKKSYESSHPQLKAYFDKNREDAKAKPQLETVPYSPNNMQGKLSAEEMKLIDPLLAKRIVANINLKEPLGTGAAAQLRQIWNKLGKPNGDIDVWYKKVVTPTFRVE